MRLTGIVSSLLVASAIVQSCDERLELTPAHCNCDIDGVQLDEQRSVTYQVAAHDEAFVSSITYHTNDGPVTTNHPSLPFSTSVQLAKGQTVALKVEGNPGKGAIVLSYDTNNDPHTPNVLSSSASRVWVLEDGICR
ncbi:hypothetical protein [Parapedobacter sp. 10938]|uniref:hypothetical protein n=1 Tax=Parapedobacter flavus TaxID=3110225 RepID=UPI002DB6493D|nr:hypothetical protein [Parapedobacter sp. 10938]MEC3880562.1 hypothetical protein [Parapedobacter sp. 10938]